MTSSFEAPAWIEPREYQQDAVNAWLDANGQGVFNMATGTGKTITSLLTVKTLQSALDESFTLIIAVPYQHLVDQWAEEVREFGANPVLAYESRKQWQERFEGELAEFRVGARELPIVVTTHHTFASDPFQRMIGRVDSSPMMLIADEMHHLGAPHLRKGLSNNLNFRLGLSATPERFYDDEGTQHLLEYFNGIVYEYGLQEAITNGALCEYYYIPHVVELTLEEGEEYAQLTAEIARLLGKSSGGLGDADLQDNERLKRKLFRRARLIGTAENKLSRLTELLKEEREIHHTLVYCGDGSVENEISGRTKRHVDAAVDQLRTKMGIRAERFTADESQAERQRLLAEFNDGVIQALVAIRCLDEGVDVPATKTAYMLASSSNPRQFVQRRGRILRKHPGKHYAVIHDFIVTPPPNMGFLEEDEDAFSVERRLVEKELDRVNMFSEASRNHPTADIDGIPTEGDELQRLKREYNLLDK
jgi:DNA phosphorothioation system restriction enzyme